MSALDRAIIKALHRPVAAAEKLVVEAAAAVVPTRPAAPRVATSPAVPLSQALANLNVTAKKPRMEEPVKASSATRPTSASTPISTSLGAMLDEALQPDLPQSALPSETFANKPLTTTPEIPATTSAKPAAALKSKSNNAAPRVQLAPSTVQNVTTGPAAGASIWHPLLQVDRIVWPAIHSRLQTAAQAAIEQMTDGLQTIGDSGHRIIGLASCASGEGVTTLLSAAARKLISRGRKVALVDGNWDNPQLAKCLGLLPQVGWEDSLLGGLPLEEVVIESLADGLAVLPICSPPAGIIAKAAIVIGLEILAREFDFVLVDLGPLDDLQHQPAPARDVTSRMDAVVLVQNVRVTPPNQLAELRERLVASNLRYAGTIQNFVAG